MCPCTRVSASGVVAETSAATVLARGALRGGQGSKKNRFQRRVIVILSGHAGGRRASVRQRARAGV
jgi:hypothetical protein